MCPDPICAHVKLIGASASGHTRLASAYGAAEPGNTILSRRRIFTENLLFDRPVSISLSGGYDDNFITAAAATVIEGRVAVRQGTVRVRNVAVKPQSVAPTSCVAAVCPSGSTGK